MKDKLEKQILKSSVCFSLFIFINELIVRLCTNNNFFSYSTLRIFISSWIFGIIISLLTVKLKYKKIVSTIICVFLTIYAWVEINLFTYLGFFMGIGNAEQGGKVVDYIKDYIIAAKWESYLLIIPLIIYLLYIWLIEKKLKEIKLSKTTYFKFILENKKHNNKVLVLTCSILVIFVIGYYGSLKLNFMQNKLQSIPNTKLIISSDNPNLYVSQFGVYTYGLGDIFISLFNIEVDTLTSEYNIKNNNNITDRVIDDTAWKLLIENEDSNVYNKLNNYFINREITSTNKKTGIYKDKNLIVILMESTNYIAIDKDRYPTIYKLWSEGTSFVNNYSPRNNCSTGNNEMTSMTSLYTINQTCTANKYKNNIYPESIFNVFNNMGYNTTSYHNYKDQYYSRKTIHKNMGSSHYYNAIDLKIPYSSVYEEWPSDTELIKMSVPNFINKDKFMVYLTTVTPHQPYGVNSEYGNLHLDKLEDTEYSKSTKRYMSKLYELDKALELLLDELEKNGKLEDTVIALFCDHYPYGLEKDEISEVLGEDVSVNNNVDHTPMIIYNYGQEPEVIDKYTGIIDLLPTLLNMFDADYDPRLYLGKDVYSNAESRVYFSDGSWQDEKGYYNSSKGIFIPNNENITYTNEEVSQINDEINIKQSMSVLAIKNNYFNYLYKYRDKYKNIESE